jgi:long-subunit acyl-CoA synthetase (AMP-forming)
MFSPMFLENKLKFSPYIKEAVIFGDKRDYVAALINIDPIVVGKWAEDRGISYTTFMDLSAKPEVADLVKGGGRNQFAGGKRALQDQTLRHPYTNCWTWTTAS